MTGKVVKKSACFLCSSGDTCNGYGNAISDSGDDTG